jgi:hypothetical protein
MTIRVEKHLARAWVQIQQLNDIMTINEAKERRRIWKMLGNKSCNHADVELERDDIGMSTGDYVCTMCGKEGTDSDLTPPKAEKTKS